MKIPFRNPYILAAVAGVATAVALSIVLVWVPGNASSESCPDKTSSPSTLEPQKAPVQVRPAQVPKSPEVQPEMPSVSTPKFENSIYVPKSWKPKEQVNQAAELIPEVEYSRMRSELLHSKANTWCFSAQLPSYGGLINNVVKRGQADLGGVVLGDIEYAIDGRWLGVNRMDELRLNKTQTISFWSPNRGLFDLKAKPGLIGINAPDVTFWGGIYTRLQTADKPWDDAMRVACLSLQEHKVFLTETAVAKAMKLGLNNYLTKAMLCQARSQQGRHGDAIRFGLEALMDPKCKEIENVLLTDMSLSALREGDYIFAAHLVSNFGSTLLSTQAAVAALLVTRDLSKGEEAAYIAAEKYNSDLISTLRPLTPAARSSFEQLKKEKTIAFDIEEGHFIELVYELKSKQFHFSTECSFAASDSTKSEFGRCASFRILDRRRLSETGYPRNRRLLLPMFTTWMKSMLNRILCQIKNLQCILIHWKESQNLNLLCPIRLHIFTRAGSVYSPFHYNQTNSHFKLTSWELRGCLKILLSQNEV